MLAVWFLAGIVFVPLLRSYLRASALDEARSRSRIVAERAIATHDYFTEELKPGLLDKLSAELAAGYFDPSWMSSSYVNRGIEEHADRSGESHYYLKDAAIDARDPANEADEIERAFLVRLENESGLEEWSGATRIDGSAWYVFMRRGESVSEPCLRCHSVPAEAPSGLLALYGEDRGFGRQAGGVASVVSVRVPLEEAYGRADTVTWSAAGLLMLSVLVALGLQYGYSRVRITGPLERMRVAVGGGCTAVQSDLALGRHPVPEIRELRDAMRETSRELTLQMELLEQTNAQLSRANSAKSAFLGSMSHELRTPLNSVIGFSGVLLQGLAGSLTDEQRRQIEMIRASGDRLNDLVRDMLDYAQAESEELPVSITGFRVQDLLDEVEDLLRPAFRERGIELRAETCGPCPTIFSDLLRVRQILLHLTGNALKFTESGHVGISCECDDSGVTISVEDTGPGIPLDQAELIFERFEQVVRGEDSAKPVGSGLGLALSRRYARALGGDISLMSTPGEGSVFSLRLPWRVVGLDRDAADT